MDGHRGSLSGGRGWNDTATAEDAGELRPADGEAVTQGCQPGLRTVGGRVSPAPASRGPSLRQLWESRTGVWGLRLSDGLLWGSTWLFSLFLTRRGLAFSKYDTNEWVDKGEFGKDTQYRRPLPRDAAKRAHGILSKCHPRLCSARGLGTVGDPARLEDVGLRSSRLPAGPREAPGHGTQGGTAGLSRSVCPDLDFPWGWALGSQKGSRGVGAGWSQRGSKLFPINIPRIRGARGAQSVKHPTPAFSSSQELTVVELGPHVGLWADSAEPAWHFLSPSISAPPPPALSQDKRLKVCTWTRNLAAGQAGLRVFQHTAPFLPLRGSAGRRPGELS